MRPLILITLALPAAELSLSGLLAFGFATFSLGSLCGRAAKGLGL